MERFKVSEKKYVLKLEESPRTFKYNMYRDSATNGVVSWLEGIPNDTSGCAIFVDEEELESVVNFIRTMRGVQ